MRQTFALLLALALTPTLHAEPELKGSPTELSAFLANNLPKLIAISGDSEVKATATKAVISLRVSTENKSLHDALRANQQVRVGMITALSTAGVNITNVQQSKFSSTPKYGMFSDKAKSYSVENVVKVIVQSEKEFQAVAAIVDSTAEVRFLGADFEYADKENLKLQALKQACDNVEVKKKIYEEKFAVKLAPKRVGSGDVSQNDITKERQASSGKYLERSVSSAPSFGGEPETSFPFGETVFRAQVTVEYSIEGK
ncbi:MAG: hypothetical protein JWM68_845 [Verrucomicrobiales bacterium]|nr:hypothetical protein [Verrucomicrobiales bacterium]